MRYGPYLFGRRMPLPFHYNPCARSRKDVHTSTVKIHVQTRTLVHGALIDHPVTSLAYDLVENTPDLLAPVHADGQHALEARDLHPALAHEHGHAVRVAERGDRQARQLLLLLQVQVEQGVRALVAGGVGRRAARRAGGDVVGHGDAGVDGGEGRGVDERGEQGAVLREDVQAEGDGAVGEEVRVQRRGEGVGEGRRELLEASGGCRGQVS
ncbi:uncharacterized protein E0L32_011587, partial [Thyridium curvatum]